MLSQRKLLLQGKEIKDSRERNDDGGMEVEKAKCECCGFTEECTPHGRKVAAGPGCPDGADA